MPYDVGKDPYLDKSTGILRNLLGIANQQELDRAESQITSVNIATLVIENSYQLEEFTWELLCKIHYDIFVEIYDWAGQPRTVELTKDKTRFAHMAHIPSVARKIFHQIQTDKELKTTNPIIFVQRLAHYYSELNVLHPFREGNGRAVRTLLTLLAEGLGWYIAWDEMDAKENISACIAGYNDDEEPLRKMLWRITEPIDPLWGQDPYELMG